jgi:hypothetical protein
LCNNGFSKCGGEIILEMYDLEDAVVIAALKKNLAEDIIALLNSSFELDCDRAATESEISFVQEVSVDALTSALVDLLVQVPLGLSDREKEISITKVCSEIKKSFLERSVQRTLEIN